MIGGNDQFLKVLGHRFGGITPDLKGILRISFSINSVGSKSPKGPRR
jgi:hypothetical protein